MDDSFQIKFGLTESSSQRYRDTLGRIAHMDSVMLTRLEMGIDDLAARLESAIREEFIRGTDSQGVSHNKTGETLDTLHADARGLEATITMGGGAPFVEFGSVPHEIPNAFGWGITVQHPGYVGDDFIGRAMHEDMDFAYEMRKMALETTHEIVREGEYGLSVGDLGSRA